MKTYEREKKAKDEKDFIKHEQQNFHF